MAQELDLEKNDRNQDKHRKPANDELEVFSVGAKGLGNSTLKKYDKEFDKMVWYVLNNCEDASTYMG